MINHTALIALKERIAHEPALAALFATLRQRAAPLLSREVEVPRVKALLSQDGGFCAVDGTILSYDPWAPQAQRCPRCGATYSGERHYRHWARAQHLWLAERAAELALIGAIADDDPATAVANDILARYTEIYFASPNKDNVLGPSHLFFSTYLESLWITNWLAAAYILREAGLLQPGLEERINAVADEAATIIAEFNEGLSNRQTWHAAALTAIAAWFGDIELAQEKIESPTGLLGHLAEGFGDDGLWYEGENYHLFAMRGLMIGMQWAQATGFDLLEHPRVREHFRIALLAPSRSALPDLTFPARRDARYGVSLAEPASLDLWEVGTAWLNAEPEIGAWLQRLSQVPRPLPINEHHDYWLHDAGRPVSSADERVQLSWWALLSLLPQLPESKRWETTSGLMADQGLAILRHEDVYASLECGRAIGGHGHPDRLHLTLHARGMHWLPDTGTGSYVSPTLSWYRSSMAHNAPILNGENVSGADAWCGAFDAMPGAAWTIGRTDRISRTLIATVKHVVDILEISAGDHCAIQLPWHLMGNTTVLSGGTWQTIHTGNEWLEEVAEFVPDFPGTFVISAVDRDGQPVHLHLHAPGGVLRRAMAPDLPTSTGTRIFYWLHTEAEVLRWVSVLDLSVADAETRITAILSEDARTTLVTRAGETSFVRTATGMQIVTGSEITTLGGLRPRAESRTGPISDAAPRARGLVPLVEATPLLDGTLAGFDTTYPLRLDREVQYRRSEEAYLPSRIAARAWLNWDNRSLYLAVRVKKATTHFRAADAEPLRLDNESDDIHSDGVQIYLESREHAAENGDSLSIALLAVPQTGGGLRLRSLSRDSVPSASGSWRAMDDGYQLTMRLDDPCFVSLSRDTSLRFDLLVNEMQPDRQRRAGQLVWGGDGGWVYLRGDRHDMGKSGVVTLG